MCVCVCVCGLMHGILTTDENITIPYALKMGESVAISNFKPGEQTYLMHIFNQFVLSVAFYLQAQTEAGM